MSLISPHWLAMRPTFVFYCDTVYQRRTTLLASASKRVNFSSRPNLNFLRFLLFLMVDISANILPPPPPFKMKSTIVILTKYSFQRGVKCLQTTDTSRNNEIYIIVLFVETPRKFITAKLSIRKPGSSSVLIISSSYY
jgi:hypothetical protein